MQEGNTARRQTIVLWYQNEVKVSISFNRSLVGIETLNSFWYTDRWRGRPERTAQAERKTRRNKDSRAQALCEIRWWGQQHIKERQASLL